MTKKDYSIGLDIGTTSVGWAAIDCKDFKVIRKGNQKVWGVRLFDEAITAESRRIARGTRRRYDRRRARIKLLQEEFNEEINKVDPNFFTKLKESAYNKNDSNNKTIKFSKEEKEQIKKYNNVYPTIYHLRHKLMFTDEKIDIRLVYLAIHHIIKYRGNFNYGTSNFDVSNPNLKELCEEMLANLKEIKSLEIEDINIIDSQKLSEYLSLESKNVKKEKLTIELSKSISKKQTAELVKLLIGSTSASLNVLLNVDTNEDVKISFKSSDYEDNIDKISKNFPEALELLESIKNIYNAVFILDLFKGKKEHNLSYAMLDNYNIHKKDLRTIKNVYKENKKLYDQMFKKIVEKGKEKPSIYEQYITNNLTYDEFRKKLEEDLKILNPSNKEAILEKLANEEFMPRITSIDNGRYPYQLNRSELIEIIKKQGQYYPFLLEKSDKLVKILEFRIPYYVGPLNNTTAKSGVENKNSWLIRKIDNVKITPYNFNEVVDL